MKKKLFKAELFLKKPYLIKEILKPGDIISCRSDGKLGRIIRRFTSGRFNHTALVIEISGELFIVDSQVDGTNIRPITEWIKKYRYEFMIHRMNNRDPYKIEVYQKRALTKVGTTPYDFKSLVWYKPRYIITGRWRGKRGNEAEKRMFCSEYVAWVFKFKNWWKISPQTLYEYLSVSEKWQNIYKK